MRWGDRQQIFEGVQISVSINKAMLLTSVLQVQHGIKTTFKKDR